MKMKMVEKERMIEMNYKQVGERYRVWKTTIQPNDRK